MMAANEAVQDGYGGISRISRACGLSRVTITKGTINDVLATAQLPDAARKAEPRAAGEW